MDDEGGHQPPFFVGSPWIDGQKKGIAVQTIPQEPLCCPLFENNLIMGDPGRTACTLTYTKEWLQTANDVSWPNGTHPANYSSTPLEIKGSEGHQRRKHDVPADTCGL